MKMASIFLLIATLGIATVVQAADITGVIFLKGTPPAEKEITPLMDDANCSALHTKMPTTRFYVVGAKGELADVVVSLKGITGKSAGASASSAVLDQKGCLYTPTILAIQTGQKLVVKIPTLASITSTPCLRLPRAIRDSTTASNPAARI